MEVAAAALAEDTVETVGPVDTHQTHHRQLYTHTGTGATLEFEGIELAHRCPCVAGLEEGQGVDGG